LVLSAVRYSYEVFYVQFCRFAAVSAAVVESFKAGSDFGCLDWLGCAAPHECLPTLGHLSGLQCSFWGGPVAPHAFPCFGPQSFLLGGVAPTMSLNISLALFWASSPAALLLADNAAAALDVSKALLGAGVSVTPLLTGFAKLIDGLVEAVG
jgi:hypothetical protein